MTLAERLVVGANLTVLGMGLVFLLLILLWGLLVLMLRLDRQPKPRSGSVSAAPSRPRAGKPPNMAPELFSAIAVAVLAHQAILRKQAAPPMRSHWPGSILFASRWVAAGRHQQTQNWRPGRR
jgi:sodium pump decarboxylase gamma subunit